MHSWIASETGRLDIFLVKNSIVISRLKASELVRKGHVLVEGRIARKPALVLKIGDKVEVSETDEPVTETRIKTMDLKLKVLYEDDACLVIEKPSGIPVHPGAGIPIEAKTILHGIAHLFKERKIPFSSSSTLVHRLDKETTGCLLVAKTAKAHKELQMQFEKRTVKKTYLAIVAGIPNPPSAVIEASIGRSSANRTRMTVMGSSKTREARTTYRTVSSSKEASLIECDLHTGRTHQIRVHMNAIKHSILGDKTYISSESEKLNEEYGITDLCLHAWKLTFMSPADKKEHSITVAPSAPFKKIMKVLGLEDKSSSKV